jgi:putative tryptophan/tyrosine transport system substrate-binding protein
MRRREFIAGLGSAAAWPMVARAQQPTIPVIGFLGFALRQDPRAAPGFLQGLKETGYVDGQNVRIEYRWAERVDQMSALAAELVRRQPKVIFAAITAAALALKTATSTIPIVFATGVDPVSYGLVASLNRPGGNATGTTILAIELGAKRLELLHQLVPTTEVIAALVNPQNPSADTQINTLQDAARNLGRQILIVHAATVSEIDTAFVSLVQQRARALILGGGDAFYVSRRNQIVTLAAQYNIPTMYFGSQFAQAGGLISYGIDVGATSRQVGIYVGRILKGEKPADLPVLQPTKFEFVINLKTAKALGLSIPETLLATADEVIQ